MWSSPTRKGTESGHLPVHFFYFYYYYIGGRGGNAYLQVLDGRVIGASIELKKIIHTLLWLLPQRWCPLGVHVNNKLVAIKVRIKGTFQSPLGQKKGMDKVTSM